MSLIPWRPFKEVDRFFNDEDFFFPVFSKEKTEPDIDLYETKDDIVAEVSVPNIDTEKIDVSVQDNILRISGEVEEEKEDKEKGYWKREIRKGSFSRAVRVPAPVEGGKSRAVYENGILKITMPKKKEIEEGEGRLKIEVK